MTIIRIRKRDNPFVMVDSRIFNNPAVSWKAKGLLGYLLSKPDNWVVRVKDIAKRAPDGATSVRSGLKELQDHGYMTYERERRSDGTLGEAIYTVYEEPIESGLIVKNQIRENLIRKTATYSNKDTKDTKGEPLVSFNEEEEVSPPHYSVLQETIDQDIFDPNEFRSDELEIYIRALEVLGVPEVLETITYCSGRGFIGQGLCKYIINQLKWKMKAGNRFIGRLPKGWKY